MDAMLAVDLEQDAQDLVTQASTWAARLGATLHVRSASTLLWTADEVFGGTETAALAMEWEKVRAVEERKAQAVSNLVPEPMRGSFKVLTGRAADALVEEAVHHDLVILGTHGRRGLSRLFLGSVAERVVREASRPVLVLRLDGQPVSSDGPLDVVVPVDAEEPSAEPVRRVRDWLGDQARIHAVYALADLALYEAAGLIERAPTTTADHPHRPWAEQRLREALPEGVQLHFILRSGENAGNDVADFAEGLGADLVALPTHGRTGLSHLAYGSVAERVVRLAGCPVLVVR
jgi:nucleotide-binding universal stress UspA family protein